MKVMENEATRPRTSCTDLENTPWDRNAVISSASGQALQRLFQLEVDDEECALNNCIAGMQTKRSSKENHDEWKGQECSREGALSGNYAVLSYPKGANGARSNSTPSSRCLSSLVYNKAKRASFFSSGPLPFSSSVPPLVSTSTVRSTSWSGVSVLPASSMYNCMNTTKVAKENMNKKSISSSSFEDFLERQKSFCARRLEKLQEVEKRLTPLFRPQVRLEKTLLKKKTSATVLSAEHQRQENEEYCLIHSGTHSIKEELSKNKEYLSTPKEVRSSNKDRSLSFEWERKALFSASDVLSKPSSSFTPLNPYAKETLKSTCQNKAQKKQETKRACTFHPSISSFAQRLPSRGNCCEYLYNQSFRQSELQREAEKALELKESFRFQFQPTLNSNRSKKSVLHLSNYGNLKEMQRQREDSLKSQRELLQREKDSEKMRECTFHPKTTKTPFFVQCMAEEYELLKGK